jgi:hypothetical protein
VLRALARDPARRYQTALEMVDALDRAAGQSSTAATTKDVADFVGELCGRRIEEQREVIRRLGRGEALDAATTRVDNPPAAVAGALLSKAGTPELTSHASKETVADRPDLTSITPTPVERTRAPIVLAGIGLGLIAAVWFLVIRPSTPEPEALGTPAQAEAPSAENQAALEGDGSHAGIHVDGSWEKDARRQAAGTAGSTEAVRRRDDLRRFFPRHVGKKPPKQPRPPFSNPYAR